LKKYCADCEFLKPVLPVTGSRRRPKQNPFEETRFYSVSEERLILLDEVANLPNRWGWLLLKGESPEAIKIRTRDLEIPQGRELEQATLSIRRDPTIGQRVSRTEYDRSLAERKNAAEEHGDVDAALEQAYRRARGTGENKGAGT
jgi:hypothetical protein